LRKEADGIGRSNDHADSRALLLEDVAVGGLVGVEIVQPPDGCARGIAAS
jgi:hypothetical protein